MDYDDDLKDSDMVGFHEVDEDHDFLDDDEDTNHKKKVHSDDEDEEDVLEDEEDLFGSEDVEEREEYHY